MAGNNGKYSGKFPGPLNVSDGNNINTAEKIGNVMGNKPVLDFYDDVNNAKGMLINDCGPDTSIGGSPNVKGLLSGESREAGPGQNVRNLPPNTYTPTKSNKRENYIKKISMDY